MRHAEYTRDRLNSIRSLRLRCRIMTVLLGAGSFALAAWLGLALLDLWLVLGNGARAASSVALAGALVLGMAAVWRLWRGRSNLKRIALEVEDRRPELGCLLSTAAEYIDARPARDDAYSSELIAGLQEHAARKLVQVETDWYARECLRASAGFAVAAAMAALFLLTVPAAGTALLRTILPWQEFVYTELEIAPGSVEVPAGENQSITAGIKGREPKGVRLEWKTEDAAGWQEAPMAERAGSYSYVFEQLRHGLIYRVSAGTVRSDEYRIATFVPPGLLDVELHVEYPAYTGLPPARLRVPDAAVVRGSAIRWTFNTKGDIERARMRFTTLPELDMEPSAPGAWSARLIPAHDLDYWVELSDAKGRKGGNPRPYQISVLPDAVPRVSVVEPGGDIRSDPGEVIRIEGRISDDFGIAHAKLVVRNMAGTSREFPLVLYPEGSREARVEAALDLAAFKLRPYEVLSYYIEAADHNELDGPGIGRSPVYFIEYTTAEQLISARDRPPGRAQAINLLVLQKDIIASTIAIPADDPSERYTGIAAIQRQTRKYADIFREDFRLAIAPAQAREEFDSARLRMTEAAEALDSLNRAQALRHEEAALQHLFEACRLLPELEAGMCRGEGDCIKIVMEEIKKLREEEEQDRQATLQEVLERARALRQRQAALADIYREQAQRPEEAAATAKLAERAPGEKRERSEGGMNPAGTRGDAGTNSVERARTGGGGEQLETEETRSLADAQRRLADEADGIARQLAELSGRDARVSSRYAESMNQVVARLSSAVRQVSQSHFRDAAGGAAEGLSVLSEVVLFLERIYSPGEVVPDLAAEEYPKAFEDRINAYLKALSYAD